MWRSVRQTPHARTWTRDSPSDTAGSGTSSSDSGSPGRWSTKARTALACHVVKALLPPDELARYADAVVKVGLAIGRGDDLIVTCQPAHREFAVAVVEAAYRAKARSVEVDYVDPYVRRAYLANAPDKSIGYLTPWKASRLRATAKPETATLLIAGESEPGVLDDIPPQKLAADMTRPI